MSIQVLFMTGLLAGVIISKFKKTEDHGLMVDMIYGVMGSTLMGGEVGQFVQFNPIILFIAVAGAFLFVELGRKIPKPHQNN